MAGFRRDFVRLTFDFVLSEPVIHRKKSLSTTRSGVAPMDLIRGGALLEFPASRPVRKTAPRAACGDWVTVPLCVDPPRARKPVALSEDLISGSPRPLGRYEYRRLGSATLNQLRRAKILRRPVPPEHSQRKPDAIVYL